MYIRKHKLLQAAVSHAYGSIEVRGEYGEEGVNAGKARRLIVIAAFLRAQLAHLARARARASNRFFSLSRHFLLRLRLLPRRTR